MFRGQFVTMLETFAEKDPEIFLMSADLGFRLFDRFRQTCPKQFLNAGVAEANMMSVGAGMALSGKNVFVYSMVPFITSRALDQIRVDVSGHCARVKIVGVGAGVGYGLEGMTHFALEDVGLMRAFPNMKIVCPADEYEMAALMPKIISEPGPVYIRLIKGRADSLHSGPLSEYTIGRALHVFEGKEVSLLSYGNSVIKAKQASNQVQRDYGFSPSVYSFPTLKPIDKECLLGIARDYETVITVEEHSEIGGLHSIVAEVLLGAGFKGRFGKIAFPDRFPHEIGRGPYLCERAGLTSKGIVSLIRELHRL